MHLPKHQEMLRNASKYGGLAAATEIIRRERPEALHVERGDEETLSKRRFMVEPKSDIAHSGFAMTADEARAKLDQRTSKGASAASNSSEATDEADAVVADVV